MRRKRQRGRREKNRRQHEQVMYAPRNPDIDLFELTCGKHGCWLFVVEAGSYTPVAAFSHGFSSTEQVCPHQAVSRMVIPVGFTFIVLMGCRCTVRNPILRATACSIDPTTR